MSSPDKPKPKFPEIVEERLFPKKGGRLSLFARTAWTLLILIALAVVWLGISRFDIGRLRGADHYLEQARTAVAAKNWDAAFAAIQKVDGEARGKPEYARIVADYLIGTKAGPASLAQMLERLHGTPLYLPEDDLWLSQAYLAERKITAARKALDRTAPALRGSLFFLETQVSVLKSEGRNREAAEAENTMFTRYANEPSVVVRKAARELTGTFPEIQQAAVERLWQAATSQGENSLAAIRVLTAYTGLTRSQAARLHELAAKDSAASVDDRLNIASTLARLDPARREAVFQAEIDRCKDAGPQPFQKLIAWLAREREFAKIVKLVPRETLTQSVELFPAVAQDLAQREQWTDLMGLLEKGKPVPVSNARAAAWRALATHKLQPANTGSVRAHLEEAFAEGLAKNDRQAISTAIILAQEWDMLDLALDVTLKLATPDSPQEIDLLEKAWDYATRLKREDVLVELAARLARLRPGDVRLARRYDYLRLLRGEAIEVTASEASSLPADSGTTLSDLDLLLAALKAYRLGDISLAASTVGNIHSTADMTPGQTAVYVGLLAKTGVEPGRVYQLAEKIHPGLLLKNEITFLEMGF